VYNTQNSVSMKAWGWYHSTPYSEHFKLPFQIKDKDHFSSHNKMTDSKRVATYRNKRLNYSRIFLCHFYFNKREMHDSSFVFQFCLNTDEE
jgi:hypothetical protein